MRRSRRSLLATLALVLSQEAHCFGTLQGSPRPHIRQTVLESSHSEPVQRRRGWHRRVLRPFRKGNVQAVAVAEAPLPTAWNPRLMGEPLLEEATTTPNNKSSSPVKSLARGYAQNVLYSLLDRWTDHENLQVHCDPISLSRKGVFTSHASVQFDRLATNNLRLSGGRLDAQALALNLWRFAPGNHTGPMYPSAFDFVAHNVTLTQDDLFQSNCIRNGLQRLLLNILTPRGVQKVTIRSIEVIHSKLVLHGVADTGFTPSLPFQVRTGLAFASRGHILTFPGLEVSLGLGMFVPIPQVTVDLGHSAQLQHLELGPHCATLGAKVTIAPTHTRKVAYYTQSHESYRSDVSVDVGRWLTRIGRFSN